MELPNVLTNEPVPPDDRKKPIMGLLSFVLGALSILFGVCFVELSLANRITLAGYDLFLIPLVMLIFSIPGLILGIVGVAQKNRRRSLSIVGIVLNTMILIVSLLAGIFFLLVFDYAQ